MDGLNGGNGTPMIIDHSNSRKHKKNIKEKQTLFLQTEKLFRDEIANVVTNKKIEKNLNLCCDEKIENMITKDFAEKIKKTKEYNSLSYADLYLTLVYLYYSLVLGEQSEDHVFTMNFLKKNAYNKSLVVDLYYKIATGDLKLKSLNISKYIRRNLLFVNLPSRTISNSNNSNKKNRRRRQRQTSKKNKSFSLSQTIKKLFKMQI